MFKLGVGIEIYVHKNNNLSKCNSLKGVYKSPYITIKEYRELGFKEPPKDIVDLLNKVSKKYVIEGFDTTHIRKEGKIYLSLRKKHKKELTNKERLINAI